MDEEYRDQMEQIADTVDVGEVAVKEIHLDQFILALWPEIVSLPLKQRWAFLLHLEQDEVMAFVQHGRCSLRGIAELLEMPPEELARWYPELPLPDNRIAGRLGVTQRQVIGLRKCARERLSRRLRIWVQD